LGTRKSQTKDSSGRFRKSTQGDMLWWRLVHGRTESKKVSGERRGKKMRKTLNCRVKRNQR